MDAKMLRGQNKKVKTDDKNDDNFMLIQCRRRHIVIECKFLSVSLILFFADRVILWRAKYSRICRPNSSAYIGYP